MAHTDNAAGAGAGTGASPPGEALAFAAGVATYNHAGTIEVMLRAIGEGLAASFPGAPVAIIHADAGSQDGTPELARRAVAPDRLIQVRFDLDPLAPPAAAAIRPGALAALFGEARRLATGCVVLDADGRDPVPAWIERLAAPVARRQMDFVAPHYLRHPLDGAITSGIAFPLLRALFGKGLRFPLVTDFACSARFIAATVDGAWPPPPEVARIGAEAWLVTGALTGEFRVCQAPLGVKEAGDGRGDVSAVLTRILGGLFLEVERRVAVWQKARRATIVPLCEAGEAPPFAGRPPTPVGVDVGRALESFRLGQRNLGELWRLVLPPATLLELGKLAARSDPAFRFPDPLWARTVYDFALGFHARVMNRDHLLAAFVPLYLGWLGSFAQELAGEGGEPDPARAEQRLEALCLRFEAEKPYLISRWRWPDRFSP